MSSVTTNLSSSSRSALCQQSILHNYTRQRERESLRTPRSRNNYFNGECIPNRHIDEITLNPTAIPTCPSDSAPVIGSHDVNKQTLVRSDPIKRSSFVSPPYEWAHVLSDAAFEPSFRPFLNAWLRGGRLPLCVYFAQNDSGKLGKRITLRGIHNMRRRRRKYTEARGRCEGKHG